MTERSLWVDYAKGLGIILVVYGHVARGVHTAGLPMDEDIFLLIDSIIYSFHMPLFFFLSGLFFVNSLQRQGSCRFVAGKLDSVLYPYVVWSFIQGGIEVLLSKYTNGNVTLWEVATLLWQPRAHFWFLYALFFVFLLATPVYRRLDSHWHLVVTGLAALLSVFRDAIPGGNPISFIYQYLVFFTLGVYIGPAIIHLKRHTVSLLVCSVFGFLAFQFVFHGLLGLDYATPNRFMALGLAVVSILAVAAVSLQFEKTGPGLLAQIGNASLGIYLMHILAGSGVRIVLQKFLGIDSAVVHLVLGTIAGIGLPLLVVRVMDRTGHSFLLLPPRSVAMVTNFAKFCSRPRLSSPNH